jgi:IS1 family transposase
VFLPTCGERDGYGREKPFLASAPFVGNVDQYSLAFVFSCNLAGKLFWCSHPREKCGPRKKAAKLPALSETVIVPEANDADASVLELDELWSFVMKKTNQAWIWIAQCRKTRQVVAYAVGDRSEKTCRCLWQSIPSAYRAGHCYSDLWKAYQAVIPEKQHTTEGKETGETAHVERWNNTLRQRLARFVRKTLSFSKSLVMHDACLKLFLHRYNLERALSLM